MLPELGVGLVYWDGAHALCEAHPDIIEVAEVEPSTCWIKAPGPDGAVRSNPLTLERIAGLPQAKLVHGVGYPIGGSTCDREAHVAEQKSWEARLDVPWTSEHLSFNETGAGAAGFLLPPSQSEATVALAGANIRERAALLGRPFAFETGVNYLRPDPREMPDGEFFAAVAEAADCLILLDLHNLWTNERNGRQRVRDVLAALPLERVVEIHLAGGLEMEGYWLDAHSGLVPPALFDLALDVAADLPNVRAMLFEISAQHAAAVPGSDVVRQVEEMHRLWVRRGRRAGGGSRPSPPALAPGPDPADWETAMVRALAAPAAGEDPGLEIYRTLIASFRGGALADLLAHSIRLIQLSRGEAWLEALLELYCSQTPPQLYPAHEALQFADWVGPRVGEIEYLADLIELERSIALFASRGFGGEILLGHDPEALVAAVAEGRLPGPLAPGEYRIALGH